MWDINQLQKKLDRLNTIIEIVSEMENWGDTKGSELHDAGEWAEAVAERCRAIKEIIDKLKKGISHE